MRFLVVAQGPLLFLAVAASWPFFSTPFFLAAQRRVVSSRQEEVAWSCCAAAQLNRGAAAPQTPRGFYICRAIQVESAHEYRSTLVLYFRQYRFEAFSHDPIAEQQILRLEPAKSKCPLEISLRRGCCGAARSSSHRRSPLTRTFAEQKCLVTAKDRRFAARQNDRCKRTKIQRSHKTERECLRNRKHSLILSALLIENHWGV